MGAIPCTWKASKVEVNSLPVEGEAIDNERGIFLNNNVKAVRMKRLLFFIRLVRLVSLRETVTFLMNSAVIKR